MLVGRARLGLGVGERSGLLPLRKLIEAHFRVADTLGRVAFDSVREPGAPARPPLLERHRRIVVGAVALLVALCARLGLFKARSACN